MLNIAVTGLNAVDNPAPGVAVIRSLREGGVAARIIGLAYEVLEPGILNPRIVDSAYLLPYPKEGMESLKERLAHVHRQEKLDILIPNLDSELRNFAGLQQDLTNWGIKTMLPDTGQLKAVSKSNLASKLATLGLKTPATHFAGSGREVEKVLDECRLPVYIKGLYYEAYRAGSVQEALYFAASIAERWGYPVLVQESVEGEELNLAMVSDAGCGFYAGVCMKKLVITGKGKGWTGVSIKNERLLDIGRAICAGVGWRGPMEIEAVQDRDGEIQVIEINPRFPAWIYLSKAAGLNLPRIFLGMILGEELPTDLDYRTGVVFSNFTTNIVTDMETIEGLFTSGEVVYEKTV